MKNILICGNPSQIENYQKAVKAFGANPISEPDLPCALLLLPGGGDIHPGLYYSTNQGSRNIDYELDIKQLQCLDYFVRHRLPVIGICKGMQVINVYFGGTICQDLPTASRHAYETADKMHDSFWTIPCLSFPNTKTLSALPVTINSAHHQSIGVTGKNLEIIQYAPDYVPEALRHRHLPILGLQWHPERLFTNKTDALQPFLDLFLN